MTYEFSIPKIGGGEPLKFSLENGQAVIVLGANGSGKTRLGAELEKQLEAGKKSVLRVTAQKSLVLNDALSLIAGDRAEKLHEYGAADGALNSKEGNRFRGNRATYPVNDFDALLQRLFAEHTRVASEHLDAHRADDKTKPPTTVLHRIKAIWDGLLPHRTLQIVAPSSIEIMPVKKDRQEASKAEGQAPTSEASKNYSGAHMSDGERAIFYFLGQCLVMRPNTALIIDEPESHVHKAILGQLWNTIEQARPDCAFVYITHDLDFAAARTVGKKFFTREYQHEPLAWDIEELPAADLPEQIVAEVAGSRQPILFVESKRGKVDVTLYTDIYSGFTVIPLGSCAAVIHAVATYNGTSGLHRNHVRGLVDADGRNAAEIEILRQKQVHVLPVAEVENLLLLPKTFLALSKALAGKPEANLKTLEAQVVALATKDIEAATVRYTMRQLDQRLKQLVQKAENLTALEANYKKGRDAIDVAAIAAEYRKQLEEHVKSGDMSGIMKLYDNKGMLDTGASILGIAGRKVLLEKVGRLLGGETAAEKALRKELVDALPKIS